MKQHIKTIMRDFYRHGLDAADVAKSVGIYHDGDRAKVAEILEEFKAGSFSAETLDAFADKIMAIEPSKPVEGVNQIDSKKRYRITTEE